MNVMMYTISECILLSLSLDQVVVFSVALWCLMRRMGLGASIQPGSAAEKLAEKRSKQIEELIEQEKVAEIKTIKLLLLGISRSLLQPHRIR